MGRITLTLDTDQLSSGGEDIKQLAEDIQAFINILHHASPDYVEAGNILQAQLDEQMKQIKHTDPRVEMKKKFREIFDSANVGKGEFSAWDIDEHHGDEPVPGYWDAWDNFMNQVGEAMGPICYAGHVLKRKFNEADQYYGWVDECIDYYEEHWEF